MPPSLWSQLCTRSPSTFACSLPQGGAIKICEASTPAREFSKHLAKKILKKMGRAAFPLSKAPESSLKNVKSQQIF